MKHFQVILKLSRLRNEKECLSICEGKNGVEWGEKTFRGKTFKYHLSTMLEYGNYDYVK